ncbi:hypothetical protein HY642_00605 [Candidatus Woesearchaeota archaeon]|nr:hypothetical protein [Candidatus Woesearchaeota archaeon]
MAKNHSWMASAAQEHKNLCDLLDSMKHAEILKWLPNTYEGSPGQLVNNICDAVNDLVVSQHALSRYYTRESSALGRVLNRFCRYRAKCEMLDRELYRRLLMNAGTVKSRVNALDGQQEASIAVLERQLKGYVQQRAKLERGSAVAPAGSYDPSLFQDAVWRTDMESIARDQYATNMAARIESCRLTITSITASNLTCKAIYDTADAIARIACDAHIALNAGAGHSLAEYYSPLEQLTQQTANLARKLRDITRQSAASPMPAWELSSATAELQDKVLKSTMP